jgi:hypothetical protein
MIHLLNETQISTNYEKFRELINESFTGERLVALNKMYDELQDRIILTPASSFTHFHNAFAGGYIDHILRVARNAIKLYDLYKEVGISCSEFTKENLLFTAIHHDLGKVGNVTENLYIPNDSQWHIENQGKVYKFNPDIHHMNTADRTFYLLNYYGVKLSEIEWISIKLTDGLFDEANKEYYIQFTQEKSLKTSLPYLMHQADLMAMRFENERWLKLKDIGEKKSFQPKSKDVGGRPTKTAKLSDIEMPAKIDFNDIFG